MRREELGGIHPLCLLYRALCAHLRRLGHHPQRRPGLRGGDGGGGPEVIPLGSTLYIEGIGFRKAQDTGSAIRGQKIDLAVGRHSDALSFGVQHRRVWLVQ